MSVLRNTPFYLVLGLAAGLAIGGCRQSDTGVDAPTAAPGQTGLTTPASEPGTGAATTGSSSTETAPAISTPTTPATR